MGLNFSFGIDLEPKLADNLDLVLSSLEYRIACSSNEKYYKKACFIPPLKEMFNYCTGCV